MINFFHTELGLRRKDGLYNLWQYWPEKFFHRNWGRRICAVGRWVIIKVLPEGETHAHTTS